MQEPCRSCDRREVDFGGCRCQALLLVNDAAVTDPVCSLSPNRNRVDIVLARVADITVTAIEADVKPAWIYRSNPV
jgi:pyrroloquinoline quinone biosynthesis protein E